MRGGGGGKRFLSPGEGESPFEALIVFGGWGVLVRLGEGAVLLEGMNLEEVDFMGSNLRFGGL